MPVNYFISGIWHVPGTKTVSHVLLHVNTVNGFHAGVKTSVFQVVNIIAQGQTVTTLRWDYSTATWRIGQNVTRYMVGGITHLRSVPNGIVADNLDNMIPQD